MTRIRLRRWLYVLMGGFAATGTFALTVDIEAKWVAGALLSISVFGGWVLAPNWVWKPHHDKEEEEQDDSRQA